MLSAARREAGFTLIELLVAMSLMLVVLGSILTAFEGFESNAAETERQADAQQQARIATDRLARELRNLASPEDSAPAIEVATGKEFVFRSVDRVGPNTGANKTNVYRVRYCVDDADTKRARIQREVQRWTTATAPPRPNVTACPSGGGVGYTEPAIVADHVVLAGTGSRSVFRYDSNVLADISFVSTDMYVDVHREAGRRETRVQTSVALRNQNRPPTADFTYTAERQTIVLNGSISTDPDGQQLTYEWYPPGVTTPLKGPVVQWTGTAGTTVNVRLKVSDGSLTHEVTKPVTVPQ